MSIWVLVADTGRARLFSTDFGNGELKEMEDFVHTDARRHARELTSDLPGRAFDRFGGGRHAVEQQVDVKQTEAIRFAEQLIGHLERGRVQHRFERLYIVAAPVMLGLLRERYGQLAPMIAGEIDRHLSQCPAEELRTHLPRSL